MIASSLTRVALGLGAMLLFAGPVRAAGLSRDLTSSDINEALSIVGFGGAHRPWSATATPNPDLGLSLGVETTFLFRRGLLEQGDETAVLPRIIPEPRFWMLWDLPAEFQVSLSFAPGFLFDGITAAGVGTQWAFYRDSQYDYVTSLVVSYTYANAFGDLTSHVVDSMVQIARDLDAWQPYAGAGLAIGSGSVSSGLVADGAGTSVDTEARMHFMFGARLNFAAKLAAQFDFYNTMVSFSALMSTDF